MKGMTDSELNESQAVSGLLPVDLRKVSYHRKCNEIARPSDLKRVRLTLVGDIDFKQLALAIEDYTSWLPFQIAASHSGISPLDKNDVVHLTFRYVGPERQFAHFESNLRRLFADHFTLETGQRRGGRHELAG